MFTLLICIKWGLIVSGILIILGGISGGISEMQAGNPGGCFASAIGGPIFGIILIAIGIWIGNWSIYQCNSDPPEQIIFAGHVTAENVTKPNDYLVTMYLDNEEIGRDTTHFGKFESDEEGVIDDGYYEIRIDNKYQLSQCEIGEGFEQDSRREGFLKYKKIDFLWHYLRDVEVGTLIETPVGDRGLNYSMYIMPLAWQDIPYDLRVQLEEQETYLTMTGGIAVRKPFYPNDDISFEPVPDFGCELSDVCKVGESDFAEDGNNNRLSDAFDAMQSAMNKLIIRDIKIQQEDEAYKNTVDVVRYDFDNCTGDGWIRKKEIGEWIYITEYNFNLGVSASLKPFMHWPLVLGVEPEIGVKHGQIHTKRAELEIEVAPRQHIEYVQEWSELLRDGTVEIETAGQMYNIPFSVKSGAQVDVNTIQHECD